MSVNNIYIGSRYVPKFDGDWSAIKSYEALIIVVYGNNTYTSKRPVPAGTVPTDTEYWALTGNFNGAISELTNKINNVISGMPVLRSNECEIVGLNNILNDGTDQAANLKDFLDYCADNNTIAYISGNVVVSEPIELPSNCHITGDGIITGRNITDNNAVLHSTNKSNISIDNIKVDINGLSGLYRHGILLDDSNNIKINGVEVYNSGTGSVALSIRNCENASIDNCIAHGAGGGLYIAENCKNVSASNFIGYECGNGIDCYGCSYVSITNAQLYDNTNVGINLDDAKHVTISNIVCYNNKTNLGIYSGEYLNVNNCQLMNASDSGITIGTTHNLLPGETDVFAKHVKIDNCFIIGADSLLINSQDSANPCKDVTISNCRMGDIDTIACIIVGENISFVDNIFSDIGSSALRIATKIGKVTGNDIRSESQHAIEVIPSAAYQTTHTVIANNVFSASMATPVADTDSQCTVTDNYSV